MGELYELGQRIFWLQEKHEVGGSDIDSGIDWDFSRNSQVIYLVGRIKCSRL